ncbi:DNA replication regulator Sld3 [Neofusicoccum parvum]|uniref:DNA replication regulator Sld3 n=1 Tax=Neofusicoccum parvum TaxID=310453 RepID=A0ACB5RY89_9PEZI|nr:DNA replication regulator Sld3 [Neofusicoccum parvum]
MLGSNCPLNRLAHYGPCPTSPYDRPITLAPVKLIERSQLPLSFLDLAGSSSIVPSTRLFSAYVEALERQSTDDDELPPTPKVLITRLEADGTLYAVERVQYGTYALCKLSAWVKEADVGSVPAFAEGLAYTQPLKALKKDDGKGAWWQRAAVSASGEAAAEQKGGLAPRISMRRPVPNIVHTGPQRQEEMDPFVDSARLPGFAGQEPVDIPVERPQTAEEVFQAIVQQYLEALYLSKTSLAFFAKGPVSRARAAFTSKDNAGMKMGDLAAFMRSILLQPGPMDKKHREKLPEIIKSMPLPGLSDDEDMAAAKPEKKTKKSKSKKVKPSKEGLYPGEEDYVKKWWVQDRSGSPHGQGESVGDALKRRLGELRVRESMAQIILVLEVLALESSPSFQATDQEETQQDETQGESQTALVKKRKPKKPQDLNVLLDLLLDRLCIWQSVEQDETLVKVSKPGSGNNSALTPNSSKSGTSDKLKNFCVEVILPFRNSLSQFERFSRRQIDLEAMSKANEAKLKKKAHIEQELEKAIGTLRKPNRGAALKDVAADTDNRRLSRKPATTTRKPAAAAVLVGATPKRGRKTKDVIQQQATPNYRWPPGMAALDPDDDVAPPPPSSDAVVPSSAIRPTSAVPASAARSVAPSSSTLPSRTQRGAGPAVEDTPSRGPAGKTVHWLFPPSSGDRAAGVAATPEAGVSRLAEKLAAGAKGGLLRPPKPPPAFRLPGEGGRGGDVEDADEGGEEGVGGDGDAGEGRG